MADTLLITDSCCDLPPELLELAGVEVLPFPYTLDDVELTDDMGRSTSYDEFYEALESGSVAYTSQVPLASYYKAYERAHASGQSVVLISLSSALSGTHDTSVMARERFIDEHPNAEIYCVDSLCASGGQGLLVLEAAARLAHGASAPELAEWVVSNRLRVRHVFTVDSFEHLVRGGRVSPAVGMAGALLNIKPVLHVDGEGRLVPLKRLRGRHHAMAALADLAISESVTKGRAIISHGTCPDDAAYVAARLHEVRGFSDILITRTGVIVGTHTGGGVLSVFFWGDPR